MGCFSSRIKNHSSEYEYEYEYEYDETHSVISFNAVTSDYTYCSQMLSRPPSPTVSLSVTQGMADSYFEQSHSSEFEDLTMSLLDFVTFYPLPQRAKVIGGYWVNADDDPDREFSADEIVDILHVVCPFVHLALTCPESDKLIRISISARFQNVRFKVVSHRELMRSTKPRVFHNVQEMIEVWPHTVKALSDHKVGCHGEQPFFRNGDRLRLVRIACLSEGKRVLECKRLRENMQLLHLPLSYEGNFAEVDDPKGYTLFELVSIARVARTLKILHNQNDDIQTLIPGIPADFDGYITMEKPQIFVQMKRNQKMEDDEDYENSKKPFLVPIDCPIDISPREDTYQCRDFNNLSLKQMIEKYQTDMPFVGRITSWQEETSVLQMNLVRPGHALIFFKRETTAKILARDKIRNRFYLIPVDHCGTFFRANNLREDCGTSSLYLKSLEKSSFPFDVKFTNNGNPYSNLKDEVLPTETNLSFEAYICKEKTVVVAKLYDGIICNCFHLPLRTRIMLQFEKRWMNPPPDEDNLRWSDADKLAEEITGMVYNKLMEKYGDYEWLPAEYTNKKICRSQDELRPSPEDQSSDHRLVNKAKVQDDDYLKPFVTPPPLYPRLKPSPRPNRSSSATQSPNSRRRSLPPPPIFSRELPPPVPTRLPSSSSLLQPSDCSQKRKVKQEKPKPSPPPLPPPARSPAGGDEDVSSSIDSQSYSYIDVETLEDCVKYRQKVFPGNVATDGVSIPSDGNVSHFTAEQMLLFLREIHAPLSTIGVWRQLRINGQDFAKMSDERLQEYNIQSTVVQFFRDRSQMRILSQL